VERGRKKKELDRRHATPEQKGLDLPPRFYWTRKQRREKREKRWQSSVRERKEEIQVIAMPMEEAFGKKKKLAGTRLAETPPPEPVKRNRPKGCETINEKKGNLPGARADSSPCKRSGKGGGRK